MIRWPASLFDSQPSPERDGPSSPRCAGPIWMGLF